MIRRALKPALSSASRLQLNAAFLRSSVTRPRLSQFLRPNATDAQSTQDTGISTIPSPSTARSEQVLSSTQQTIPPPQVSASAVQNEAAASVSEVAGIPSMPAPTTSDGAKSQSSTMPTTKSLEEESKQVKLFLPMVREPKTGRPTASNFETGAFLRVEWNGAWWRAAVKETTETEVKVGFSTWSNSHDEWLPKVSDRLRIAETEEPESRPPLPSPGYELPVAKPFVNKGPFVPKPHDPKREFQKRQQSRLQLNPALARGSATRPLRSKFLRPSAVSPCADVAPPPPLAPSATKMETSPVATAIVPDHPPLPTGKRPATGVCSQSSGSGSTEVATGGIPGPPSVASAAPMVTSPVVAVDTIPDLLPLASSATEPARSDVTKAGTASAVPSSSPHGKRRVAVRWEEVLSEKNQRYYYVESATGLTQWELPTAGWVQLVHEDGGRYFWHVETGTRQWTAPKV